MSDSVNQLTVYRSMDTDAKDDCEAIVDLLAASSIAATIVDDTLPGVPEGTYEVRVAATDAAIAEKLIDENPLPDEVEEVDDSPGLDLETIFSAVGTHAEMQAMGIKSVLDSSGIASVMVGDSVLPYLPFEVKVARDQAERARTLIAEAEELGSAAADEAEIESESGAGKD